MRTIFSASDSSPAIAGSAATRQGTGWSASIVPSSAKAFMAASRRPPAITAQAPASAGPSMRTTRFSSRPWVAMEAFISASATGSAGVLRTFSGASASRLSGTSRMSGSCRGAM